MGNRGLAIQHMREARFTKADRSRSYSIFQAWIDEHNEKYSDPGLAHFRVRAGLDRTLNYLAKTYLDQLDAGLGEVGFFETSIALIAKTIHMTTKSVARHLKKLVDLEFLLSYDFAGAASNMGHGSNIKVQIKYDWVRMLSSKDNGIERHTTARNSIIPLASQLGSQKANKDGQVGDQVINQLGQIIISNQLAPPPD